MEVIVQPQFASLDDALFSLFGSSVRIKSTHRIAGGDINQAYGLELTDGTRVFMKMNSRKNASFFSAEAVGLAAVADTGVIGTPKVLGSGVDEAKDDCSFLLLEFIEGNKRISDYWGMFARQLAAMHKAETSALVNNGTYGFFCDNFIGSGKQKNTAHESWIQFFRDCRLEPQFRKAADYFGTEDFRRIGRLLDHLEDILVEPEYPSLLHGDLWSGNVITGNDGRVWLIDPAVYVGCAEADIAMTELFGGFPPQFYDIYKETGLLLPGYGRRKNLYNLYHLLNHLNLFGRSYLPAVGQIVREYQ